MSTDKLRRICVFGAGSIGGALAARLATTPKLAGLRVSVVARGAHLEAIRAKGLRLWSAGQDEPTVARIEASDEPSDLGPQDLVITALKGHQLPAAARSFPPLLGPATRVVVIQNGVPFWYFHGDVASGLAERRIPELDPDGLLWDLIGPSRIIGGVTHQAAEIVAPGDVRLTGEGWLTLGEPTGTMSDDLEAAAALLEAAGWPVTRAPRIRDEIWRKLIGNAAFNPISALTRATLSAIIDDPDVCAVVSKVMTEVIAVAQGLGVAVEITAEQRIAQAARLGPIRSSMLQDLEAGRNMEIVPLVRAVSLLGAMANAPTPTLDVIHALVKQLDRSARS